ncbi:MAG: extracellular solute-binding protein [Clostridiales bacterium]|nr:extracellular solute-binding protein [Clostridiales bacterium]
MKKITAVLLSFILAISLLAGCAAGPSSEALEESDSRAELEVWMCYDRNVPGSYYVFLWDTLAEEYGYTVNVKTYSQQEIEDKLQMAMACNELPDIFMVPGGSYPETLFASGACLPLDEYLRQADFKEEYTLPYTDGTNYLIPCLPESYAVVYYDESLMDEMGLSVPENWGDLVELVQTVQAYNAENGTDYAAIEMGMKDSWMGALFYCMLAEQLDPALYSDLAEGLADEATQQEDAARQLMGEAAGYLQELMELDAFPEDYMEIGEAEAVKNFINHDAVLMVHQASLVYHLIQNMGADGFLVESFPEVSDASDGSSLLELNHTYTPGLAVSARSGYADEAAELCLEFAKRVNEINVEEYNYLNMMNTEYESQSSSSENVERIHTLTSLAEAESGFLYAALPQETGNTWGNMIKRFLAGEVSAEEFCLESEAIFFNHAD